MRPRLRPLTLAALSTTMLLLLGAALATLGAFDDALRWDLFSPRVESVLRGVFAATMVLAAFGVGITVVVGIHAVATAMGTLAGLDRTPGGSPSAPLRRYLAPIVKAGLVVAMVVVGLSVVDRELARRRDEAFGQQVETQLEHFGPAIAHHAAVLPTQAGQDPPEAPQLAELVRSLEGQPFISTVTLMLAHPEDPPALWRFELDGIEGRWRRTASPAAHGLDRAVLAALGGDPDALVRLDAQERFVVFWVARDEARVPRAVVRIEAARSEHAR